VVLRRQGLQAFTPSFQVLILKILFAIQATGNGHISRAREVLPVLLKYSDVDLLVSGTQSDIDLPYMIRYKKKGISYTFGKKGGIDYYDSIRKFRPFNFISDILQFPVRDYDLVINDFEPITAWACRLKGKDCVAFSHQAAFLSDKTPRPLEVDKFAERVLKFFAPSTSAIGLHFEAYDSFIKTPVIRSEVRSLQPKLNPVITVYLPAYTEHRLISNFEKFPDFYWEIFSKHARLPYRQNNVRVIPVNNKAYLDSLANCTGLVTGGGFEAPAEATYLGKKVMVIPMFNQYEQRCNARAFEQMGGTMIEDIDQNFEGSLRKWLYDTRPIDISFPDNTEEIIQEILTANKLS
jgi:uncharacterized protein (TIGR00661 family)